DDNESQLSSALPFALESLEIMSLSTSEMYAWVRYSSDITPKDKVQKLNIDICDEQGKVCAKIRGLTFQEFETSSHHRKTVELFPTTTDFGISASIHKPNNVELKRLSGLEVISIDSSPENKRSPISVSLQTSHSLATSLSSTEVLQPEPFPQTLISKETLEEGLKASLAKALYMKKSYINREKPFVEMGLDSIVGVEWIQAINQEYKTNIAATKVYDYPTLKEFAGFLYKGISKKGHFSITEQQGIQEDNKFPNKHNLEKIFVRKTRSTKKERFFKQVIEFQPKHEKRFKELYFFSQNYQGNFQQEREVSIQYMINPENNVCLREHIVFGEYLFPTDAYIELVYSACKTYFAVERICLKNVFIVNPLLGFNHKNIYLRVVFQDHGGRLQFNVKSSFSPNYENEKNHMKGLIVPNTTKDKNISRYKNNSDFTIEKEFDAVEAMSQSNITVGKFYSTVQKLSFGNSVALGHIKVLNHGLKFLLDPSVISAGLATTMSYGPYQVGKKYEINGDSFLPYRMEDVSILGSFTESSYICYTEIKKVEKDVVELYFEIIDQACNPVIVVETIRLQRVSKGTIQQQVLTIKNPELVNKKNTHRIESLISKDIFVSGSSTDVAIIGMSCRYPMSESLDGFWNNLKEGKDCITEVPVNRWNGYKNWYHQDPNHPHTSCSKWGGFIENVDTFDPLFFGISPTEAEIMDPQQRIFLEECWKAIEYAAYSPDSLENQSCGVYVGCAAGDYSKVLESQGHDTVGSSFMGTSSAILAARISYFLNLKGPSMAIDTACSSSLTAIHLACESIRNRENQLALAGGISLFLTPLGHILTSQVGMQSKDGRCYTFDKLANGVVFSEGCGVVLLKSLNQAKLDKDPILGVIKASGINQDGKTNGITAPSSTSQEQLLIQTYKKYNIAPGKISYVEAHGTGTPLGDPIEVNALTAAFRNFTQEKNYCALGSVKSNLGHAGFAAGVCGVIKVLLSMKYKKLVPSIHYKEPNPHLHFEESPFYVNTRYQDWKSNENEPRIAAVSSFGFSGTNAHLVIEEATRSFSEARPKVPPTVTSDPLIIPLSAKNRERLRASVEQLYLFLLEQEGRKDEQEKVSENVEPEKQAVRHQISLILAEILQLKVSDLDLEETWEESRMERFHLALLQEKLLQKWNIEVSMEELIFLQSGERTARYLVEQKVRIQAPDPEKQIFFKTPEYRIENIAYTLQVGRAVMEERVVFIVKDEFDLMDKFQAFLENEESVKDCYQGNVKGKEENLEEILVDEDMSQTIASWISKKKFSKLMKLWVKGFVFDWNKLYGESRPKRIGLPTYPFARERYWISESENIVANNQSSIFNLQSQRLHPLLHENTSDL
ncbi:MAG: hypothetical protein GY941_18505, partial [Planctomycetes bacterium]|nr:hypothetical protein [Planctomycetota bacterium]